MKARKGRERRDVGIRAWTRSDYICDGVGCARARARGIVGLLDGRDGVPAVVDASCFVGVCHRQ